MKKLSILTSLLMGVLFFASCDADRDDNPVLDLTKTQEPIKLNTPTFADGFYDLQNTDTMTFACTAPDYGFPATVTYAIELSIDEDMSKPTKLTTTYWGNRMKVPGREVAIGVTKQMMDKMGKKREDFPVETAAYIRIHAYIDGVNGTETYSNVVKLNKVKTRFALPDVEMPEQLYVMGNFTNNDWEQAVHTVPVNGQPSAHWRIAWFDKDGVWTSPVIGPANYADDYIDVSYACKTSGFNVDENGKITTNDAGWYVMLIESKSDNDKRTMKLSFSFFTPELYLIGKRIINSEIDPKIVDGDGENGCWNEKDLRNKFSQYVKFENPTKMTGEFVSPELTNYDKDGGPRAYVKIKEYEWWKTEFIVNKKEIVYRGNGGELEQVAGSIGQKVYLNFSDDTGDIK